MKIAIVHYHLHRGGVTRVIENTTQALKDATDLEIAVFTGEIYEGNQLDRVSLVPGLGYQKEGSRADARALAESLRKAAREAFGSLPDVWHIHNHSLGKNVGFPEALQELLLDGARVLLHVHDFAEDGRPANYAVQRNFYAHQPKHFDSRLYPNAPQVHYATLNQRDASYLRRSGLRADRLHTLPNAIDTPPGVEVQESPYAEFSEFLLYPTRGIRRKNLGELALLSLLAGPGTMFATTLEPDNETWQPIHDAWRDFFLKHDNKLHVETGIGQQETWSYPELITAADAMVTTSVAEGFGLAFLEPWLAGKAVVGRNLPAITDDFADSGVDLSHLYERLDVPLSSIREDALRDTVIESMKETYSAYEREIPKDAMDRWWSAAVTRNGVDFGRLNEEFQMEALVAAIENPALLESCGYPKLGGVSRNTVTNNQKSVDQHFDSAAYADRLLKVYASVADSPLEELRTLDCDAVLDAFLLPETFMLLRS